MKKALILICLFLILGGIHEQQKVSLEKWSNGHSCSACPDSGWDLGIGDLVYLDEVKDENLGEKLGEDEKEVVSAEAIEAFLADYDTPLKNLGGVFVRVGREHNVDPALLVALSCVESTCGERYPRSTNNPFGLLFGGGNLMRFHSLDDSMDYLGELLSEKPAYQRWREDQSDLYELALVYKAVPPYERWVDDIRNIIEGINGKK